MLFRSLVFNLTKFEKHDLSVTSEKTSDDRIDSMPPVSFQLGNLQIALCLGEKKHLDDSCNKVYGLYYII